MENIYYIVKMDVSSNKSLCIRFYEITAKNKSRFKIKYRKFSLPFFLFILICYVCMHFSCVFYNFSPVIAENQSLVSREMF